MTAYSIACLPMHALVRLVVSLELLTGLLAQEGARAPGVSLGLLTYLPARAPVRPVCH